MEFYIDFNKKLGYNSKDANYTFMNYSDIHIDKQHNIYYTYSEMHFEKALEVAYNRNVDFIVTAGDNVTNAEGPSNEFDTYQQILADSPYCNPIYEGSGNHEIRVGEPNASLTTFADATGLNSDKNDIKANKPYYCMVEPNSNDLFIFMSLEFEYNPQDGNEFSKKQLKWLKNILEENYGKETMEDPGIAAEPVNLRAGEYFVLGDNRNNSIDSRSPDVGIVRKSQILGSAWLRLYPHIKLLH